MYSEVDFFDPLVAQLASQEQPAPEKTISADEKEKNLVKIADSIQKFYRYKGYNTSEG